MRTTRLRQKIKKFLDVRGEANTTEILEHVNSTMRHGTTPQQLGNVLSKHDGLRVLDHEVFQAIVDLHRQVPWWLVFRQIVFRTEHRHALGA